VSKKKPHVIWAEDERQPRAWQKRKERKVRSGAMHKNQEELSMERSKAFAKRVEKVGRSGYITLIEKPKAPWLYPKVLLRTIPAKKKVVS